MLRLLFISAASVVALIGAPVLLLRRRRRPARKRECPDDEGVYPECLFMVSLGEAEISVTRPDGRLERLPLAELREVAIVTNDLGPWGADLWWQLVGRREGSGCTFPGGATGESKVLEFVQRLPGFSNETFIHAMGSSTNARFSCWQACA